eukprot:scaffold2007_cov161-Ochromonas_danica.AAC.2
MRSQGGEAVVMEMMNEEGKESVEKEEETWTIREKKQCDAIKIGVGGSEEGGEVIVRRKDWCGSPKYRDVPFKLHIRRAHPKGNEKRKDLMENCVEAVKMQFYPIG